jgi:hypothetical protein
MLYVTTSASLHQDIVNATRQLWPDPWFRATLADAYCASSSSGSGLPGANSLSQKVSSGSS